MKKLAVVLAALLLACVFVGCGLNTELMNTTWERSWTVGTITSGDRYEFKAGNEFVYSYIVAGVKNDGYTGKWLVSGDTLTLTYTLSGKDLEAKYKIEIDDDEMKMYYTDEAYFTYKKVK